MKQKYKLIEATAWVMLLLSFAIAIYGMNTLPKEIATHFAADGTPDGYGSPAALLLFPIIMALTIGIMSLVVHLVKPELWNMPFQVKEEHKEAIYEEMQLMMVLIELESAIFMLLIEWKCFRQDGAWMLLYTGIFCFLLTATIIIQYIRAKKKN